MVLIVINTVEAKHWPHKCYAERLLKIDSCSGKYLKFHKVVLADVKLKLRVIAHVLKMYKGVYLYTKTWSCGSHFPNSDSERYLELFKINRISCVGLWQGMKHGSITTYLIQKGRHSGWNLETETILSYSPNNTWNLEKFWETLDFRKLITSFHSLHSFVSICYSNEN